MSRLAATVRCDVRLQLRNGFYYATAVVVVGSIALLRFLPQDAAALILPVVLLENVLVNTYFFAGGLILLEKNEGTLEAQVVTPLRGSEYLASKTLTLTTLSVVEATLIVVAVTGPAPGLLLLVPGVAIAAVLLTLFGVAIVSRYDSINEYIMPSVVYSSLLSLPILGYLGIGPRLLHDLHPIQGPLVLIGACFEPVGPGRLAYALLYPIVWVWPVFVWSRGAMRHVVTGVAGKGAR